MAHRSYNELTSRIEKLARLPFVRMETLGLAEVAGRDYPMYLLHLGEPTADRLGVTVSAGIHGDEPGGVEAALQFIESAGRNEALLSRFHFIVFPCDNPSGWELGTRENAEGVDLNRQFAAPRPAAEAALIMGALAGRCFDLVFEMHEDIDAPGFYMYELAEDPADAVGARIVEAVRDAGYPINMMAEIEGLPAQNGVISPRTRSIRRKTRLPKAVYTYRTCGGHVMTLEPPVAVLPIEDRVRILLMALDIALGSALRSRDHK